MTAMLLAVVLGATAVHVDPAAVTLGNDASAQIEVLALDANDLPLKGAKVSLLPSVGEISAPQSLGGGRFRARFKPPADRFPQVALVLVRVEAQGRSTDSWVSIPLQANADLKIETKRRATVRVDVGSLKFGPVRADGRGRALVHAVVPPGIENAIVHSLDDAGNSTDKAIPLNPRPFQRVLAAPSREAASWIDEKPAELEVFAVDPGGKPISDASHLHASAALGQLGPVQARGKGVFAFAYRAPDVLNAEVDHFTIALDDAPPARTELKLLPGPPVSVAVSLSPAQFVAGSGAPVKVLSRVVDAKGNRVKGVRPSLSAAFGTLRETDDGALWTLPDDFGGRRDAVVRAVAGNNHGEATLALSSAAPSKASVVLPHSFVHAGETLEGTLSLRDRFGNPVSKAQVTATSEAGRAAELAEKTPGEYQLRYASEAPDATGANRLTVRSERESLGESPAFTVLHFQRPWGLSAALGLVGQSNFGHASAFIPRFELGMRLGHSEFEGILQFDARFYAPFTEVQSGFNEKGELTAFSGAIGARFTVPLSVSWAWQMSLVLGSERVHSKLTATDFPTVSQEETRPFGLLRPASGLAWRVGPGRLFGQLEYELSQAKGQITGNIGGLALSAGYAYAF